MAISNFTLEFKGRTPAKAPPPKAEVTNKKIKKKPNKG